MSGVALSLLTQAAVLVTGAGSYAEAYHAIEASGEPMVVVVGADWCPHCVTMKRNVLPGLVRSAKMKNVPVAYVNVDNEPNIAYRMMRGGSVPQVIVYKKTATGWYTRRITGGASQATVEQLVADARKQPGPTVAKTVSTSTTTSGGQ